jgi:hypothetical protein
MIPPYQQRGQPISPSAFNALIDEVKSNQISSIVGGNFNRTIGGTSINIPSGNAGGGGQSGGSEIPCPFECSDVSDEEELKIEIDWGLIWQMLPTGMFPDNDPTLKLTIAGNRFIYSRITFNTDTLLPTAVDFSAESELKTNTSTVQYNLIAVVLVSTNEPKTITKITNICQQPFPSPCALASA